MQTQKMSLANMQGKMSRNEMKQISGGYAKNCNCSCNGGTGSWTYTREPSGASIKNDIRDYCSSGSATCGGCTNIGS